jgi:hypothetical protein
MGVSVNGAPSPASNYPAVARAKPWPFLTDQASQIGLLAHVAQTRALYEWRVFRPKLPQCDFGGA